MAVYQRLNNKTFTGIWCHNLSVTDLSYQWNTVLYGSIINIQIYMYGGGGEATYTEYAQPGQMLLVCVF